MSSDLDCRAPRARACANLVPIPRALKNCMEPSHLKVAPYSFMTARALMMRAVVICARSHKILGFPDIL